ncbi:uroporphyrinogen decarboxylase [Clostridium carboxidivorans P7]|uniref:Uroporphyrinogen decarboxylase (URO-D) n=1 Tax=Clostridium carboxidivorans P7 TaxID=536227 RepID=C6PZT2_9CLOT|nr:uroporphyrinogen decarboxylase family protein [Clostridium carboxidivorans]AKN31757.1 uroporphyrinogen decarboxylase [Clostridium carboxidivorans P7]EET85239.1 Uroporphyrinogen decarboxylase (URO-D) [Clostridium carboxidivorans P7]EFG87416.1 methyltransferase, MtaA/CmuA family [Clostridium carboxidivorans P7]
MQYDEMTPKERAAAINSGKPFDRIQCCPLMGEVGAKFIGVKISKLCFDYKLMVDTEINSYKTFGFDGAGIGPNLFGIAEAMGTTLAYPDNDMPYIDIPFLKNYDDIKKLIPVNPHKDGRLPLFLEACKIINEKIGSEVGVSSGLGGPFTTAASLRGTDVFLRDIIKNPEWVHKLLEISTESIFNYIDAVSDIGVKPSLAEPVASLTVISPKQFRTFVKPYLKKCVDKIIERWGSGPSIHICGNTKGIWEDIADTGAQVISVDNVVDMEEVKNSVGNRSIIMGNVKPIDTVCFGGKEEIFNEVKECIKKSYDSPKGFILSTGCKIPMKTSKENVELFMQAARTYGKYPINPKILD